MESHPIENLLKSTMENLKDMIDVNTIVGDAVESKDGSLIIPISRVSFGFVSGGSEYECKNAGGTGSDYPFGGGSGAGVTVKPIAFLVIKGDSIRLLSLDQQNTYDKLVDSIPQVMDFFKNMCCKDKKNKNEENSCTPPPSEQTTGC
ncbi:GerW family sporulation protein [Clostridiaceae bacterium UIB06]|uniref:GerW family sporulation protein n=1 Tax=Clostridium thailandense TaxID=2794346 RepID=A0A949U5E3_9CLOT|nr:GerW family sporulation protein [Clostridium thailandense]MBV7276779.1 GerW family sporulation protein [Clostridium thailandense]MCH5136599.1 GerW family sporulation protein [Clostridiaceae bacterium UIB06]